MNIKAVIILVIFLLFGLPILAKFLFWTAHAVINPSPENIGEGAKIVAESAIPWWLGIVKWLAGLGTIGAILIIGFIYLLKWVGEIKG